MKSVIIILLLGISVLFAQSSDENATFLLQERFVQADTGLAAALLQHEHIDLAPGGGPDGSAAIRVAYVGYVHGSERVVVPYPLGSKTTAATLEFDVSFDTDFQWVRGGKLHGLGPLHRVTGGQPRRPDGWSARMMWKSDGRLATYLYEQSPEKKWGIGDNSAEPVLQAGQWHHIQLHVKLNEPDKANGLAQVYVDEKLVAESRNVQFRAAGGDSTLIQKFLFSTFHGGNTPDWAPHDDMGNPVTLYAWFDNFVVWE